MRKRLRPQWQETFFLTLALVMLAAAFVSIGVLLASLLFTIAHAHDAPSGWTYPAECCSKTDCRPVECDQIVEETGGWRYLPTNTFFDKWRVKPTQDGHCHVCMNNDSKNGRCAFVGFGM